MNNYRLFNRAIFILLLLIVMVHGYGQTGLNFQGVARTNNNIILASQPISLRLSILQGSASGIAEYVETRRVTTNAQGLFTAVIGDTGAISTLGNFTTINWRNTPKFLKIEMDVAAGTNFITMGTTQFQYVAYAQFANSVDAENITGVVPVARGGTGANSLSSFKITLALNNVNNTSDLTKPISTATQTALDLKLNAADTVKYVKQTYADSALITKLNFKDTVKFIKQTYADSALLTKLKLTDTASMLSNRIGKDTLNLSARINVKANMSDLTTGLALKLNAIDTSKYTKQSYSDSALLTKLKLSDTASMLSNRIGRDTLNLSARINLKANSSDMTSGLLLKENAANKSTAVDLGGTSPSDILFPTQKAVKEYVTANASSGGVADAGITTIKLADGAVTDAKINTVNGSKVIGSITGNAATATLATNATTAGNITATSNTTLTTLSSLTSVGTLANLTVTNPIIGSITGNAATATTATTAGTATTTIGNAGTATKLATPRNINGIVFDGTGDITVTADAGTLTGTTLKSTVTSSSLTSVGTLANLTVTNLIIGSITGNAATATTAGNITATSNTTLTTLSSLTSVGTLASLTVTNPIIGSVTGNAATATTAGNITATTNTTLTSLSNLATVGTITSGVWNGTAVAVEKGGTGLTATGSAGQVLTSSHIEGTLFWSKPVFLPTVVIGTQQWMEKNLDVLTYRNGDIIPQVTDATEWASLTTGAWCYYNNDPLNGAIYGKLYNSYAVNDPRGLAPEGWFIPIDDHWYTLSNLLGGVLIAGGKMKIPGFSRWSTPNTNATNESGFAGLPGGYRDNFGTFRSVGDRSVWWTSISDAYEMNMGGYYSRSLDNQSGGLGRANLNPRHGLYVRCIRY